MSLLTPKKVLLCPVCGSNHLHVYEEQAWDVNTGEFWCMTVKSHDSNAKVQCQDNSCCWIGERSQLIEHVA